MLFSKNEWTPPKRTSGYRLVSPAPEHAATTNMMRTAPLWGLRTRNRLMHDGLSFTKQEAIQRHRGQAAPVRDSYNALTDEQKGQVIEFLNSL